MPKLMYKNRVVSGSPVVIDDVIQNNKDAVTSGAVYGALTNYVIIRKYTKAGFQIQGNQALDIGIPISQVSGYKPLIALYSGNNMSNSILCALPTREVLESTESAGFWLYNVSNSSYTFEASCTVIYTKK